MGWLRTTALGENFAVFMYAKVRTRKKREKGTRAMHEKMQTWAQVFVFIGLGLVLYEFRNSIIL